MKSHKLLCGVLTAITVITCVSAAPVFGDEIFTYRFVDDGHGYAGSCGECSLPDEFRGQIAGTFSIEINRAAGTGQLLSLNADIHNPEAYFLDHWQPTGQGGPFVVRDRSSNPFDPPLLADFGPADFTPLGTYTLTEEILQPYIGKRVIDIPMPVQNWIGNGIGFQPAPPNSWQLTAYGFDVVVNGNNAWFSFYDGIADSVKIIGGAKAVLIPEPSGLSLACLAVVSLIVLSGGVRIATQHLPARGAQ